MALALTSLLLRNIRIRGTVCVLSRINLSHPSRHSTPNSRPFNLLQPLCSLFSTPVLCFQSLAASFCKTPGVGGTSFPESSLQHPASSTNSLVSYHLLVNPVLSCNYTHSFCATAAQQTQHPQLLAHPFYRHGGGTPLRRAKSRGATPNPLPSSFGARRPPPPGRGRLSGKHFRLDFAPRTKYCSTA